MSPLDAFCRITALTFEETRFFCCGMLTCHHLGNDQLTSNKVSKTQDFNFQLTKHSQWKHEKEKKKDVDTDISLGVHKTKSCI